MTRPLDTLKFYLGRLGWVGAAGALLILEAGGMVSDFGGGEEYLFAGNIVCGTPKIHEQLLALVQEVHRRGPDAAA